jgi:hypothetical protein
MGNFVIGAVLMIIMILIAQFTILREPDVIGIAIEELNKEERKTIIAEMKLLVQIYKRQEQELKETTIKMKELTEEYSSLILD